MKEAKSKRKRIKLVNSTINRFWGTKIKEHQREIDRSEDPELADRINTLSIGYWMGINEGNDKNK